MSQQQLPFRKVLKELMLENKLNANDLARLADTPPSTVHSWLLGSVPQDLHAVARLSRALDIPFYELIFGLREQRSIDQVIASMFHERDIMTGYCKIDIKKLVPKEE